MPTYEYLCPEGHEFERLQKMSDRTRVKCPECGRVATRRISGGAGLVFKGSGFYITDYGKDGKGPRKVTPESGDGKAESPSTKAEPQPASPSPAREPAAGKKAAE